MNFQFITDLVFFFRYLLISHAYTKSISYFGWLEKYVKFRNLEHINISNRLFPEPNLMARGDSVSCRNFVNVEYNGIAENVYIFEQYVIW